MAGLRFWFALLMFAGMAFAPGASALSRLECHILGMKHGEAIARSPGDHLYDQDAVDAAGDSVKRINGVLWVGVNEYRLINFTDMIVPQSNEDLCDVTIMEINYKYLGKFGDFHFIHRYSYEFVDTMIYDARSGVLRQHDGIGFEFNEEFGGGYFRAVYPLGDTKYNPHNPIIMIRIFESTLMEIYFESFHYKNDTWRWVDKHTVELEAGKVDYDSRDVFQDEFKKVRIIFTDKTSILESEDGEWRVEKTGKMF